MSEQIRLARRTALKGLAASTALAGMTWTAHAAEKLSLKGRIKQAACPGAFGKSTLERKCEIAVELGLKGLDFIDAKEWPTLAKFGLICTMVRSHSLTKGLNRIEHHEECLAAIRKGIDQAAEAGYPNVICFSGNRAGISDELGLKNCVVGLKQVAGYAEEKKITLCMELLNSKRNHKDYQCDHTAWGVEMCKQVGSPRVKLLYDIYHMQIQEGDIIATIRESIQYFGHIHTAGVPGRNEIDDTQELYYPAIMRAIAETKYDGYVAHEYGPKRDAYQSLRKAVEICDV